MNLQQKYSVTLITGEEVQKNLEEIFSQSEKTLLYFYPQDNTPGCTVENTDFTNMNSKFQELGIQLIGVSKNDHESHKQFITEQNLKTDLISDLDFMLHKELGAYGEKNNYGKIVTGVIRSTFLFDRFGNILQEWKNIRAKGHAAKVLREIKK